MAINRLALDAAADLVLRALNLAVLTPLASKRILTHFMAFNLVMGPKKAQLAPAHQPGWLIATAIVFFGI